jgi:hypothetical protein
VPPSAVAKKLLIKPGQRMGVVNAPPGWADTLWPLPDGATIVDGAAGDLDFLLCFAANAADLDPVAFGRVKPDGLLWVAYKKGGTKAGTDLNRDILWAAVGEHGLVGVSLVALDDTWSALRFRRADRIGK